MTATSQIPAQPITELDYVGTSSFVHGWLTGLLVTTEDQGEAWLLQQFDLDFDVQVSGMARSDLESLYEKTSKSLADSDFNFSLLLNHSMESFISPNINTDGTEDWQPLDLLAGDGYQDQDNLIDGSDGSVADNQQTAMFLVQWLDGFLYSYGMHIDKRGEEGADTVHPISSESLDDSDASDATEIISDFARMSALLHEDISDSEEDSSQLTELVEYVKIGVLNLWYDAPRSDSNDETLH